MSNPSAGWAPPDWEPPPLHARAPVPLSKVMLLQWLRFHCILGLEDSARMHGVVAAVEVMYGATCPNTGDGPIPATWDVWAFVAAQEKRIRGGQMSLLEGEV